MKATGIIRKVDDLGRIVIPMELRRTMNIDEGKPLEIFTDDSGQIILRKYNPGCTACGTSGVELATTDGKTRLCRACVVNFATYFKQLEQQGQKQSAAAR